MTYIRDILPNETLSTITMAEAEKALDAAIAKTVEQGVELVFVVVDVAGEVVGVRRMDGVRPFNFDAAYSLAYTAALFQLPGERLAGMQNSGWFDALFESRGGRIAAASVCRPLKRGDNFIGAIGTSGADSKYEIPALDAAVAAVA